LRYENIRNDFDNMLQKFGLPKLEQDEFPWLPAHRTTGKPREGYRQYWELEAREWVEQHMRREMDFLGYRW
jgi:hypothetical protein